jgi:hypothetical protein
MLVELIRLALDDEALVSGLATRLSDLKARMERLEARAKRKPQLALRVMSDAVIPKLAVADVTASLNQWPPAVEVLAEEQIPAVYWKPQPAKLDKHRILAANEAGETVLTVSVREAGHSRDSAASESRSDCQAASLKSMASRKGTVRSSLPRSS